MRAKRDWERVRSPHARFLEGLQAAIAAHPSASARFESPRGGADDAERSRTARARLTVVGSTSDNVIPLPTDRHPSKPRPRGRSGNSPAA